MGAILVLGAPGAPWGSRGTRTTTAWHHYHARYDLRRETWLGCVADQLLRSIAGTLALRYEQDPALLPTRLLPVCCTQLPSGEPPTRRVASVVGALYHQAVTAGGARGFGVSRRRMGYRYARLVILMEAVRRLRPPVEGGRTSSEPSNTPTTHREDRLTSDRQGQDDDRDALRVRLRRSAGAREYQLGDELLVYVPHGESAFALNESAQAVWDLCDGSRTDADIVDELTESFEHPPEGLRDDVRETLKRLQELGLLEIA